jgi:hypothetical protein
MPKRINHEEHEGHEEWTPDKLQCHLGGCSKQDRLLHPPGLRAGLSASSSDPFVLFVSFVVKESGARVLGTIKSQKKLL